MRRLGTLVVASALGAIGALALVSPASATEDKTPKPVASFCNEGWFVNWDEEKHLPTQVEDGILLDGPKLFKRTTDVLLKDAPNNGGFKAKDVTGNLPLFKMETLSPYSTINKTAAGKFWSSKINDSDLGGQSNPVDSLQDLLGKPLTKTPDETDKYLDTTRIFTIGVGYANDMGNKATVEWVKFGRGFWYLGCKEVTATPPTFTDKTCEDGAYILIPRDKNVTYKVNDVRIWQRKDGVKVPVEDVDKEYVVTVTANSNRYLKDGSTIKWVYKLTEPECTNPTTPPATNPPTVPPANNGGSAGGGGLPVTGPQALLIGGIGTLVVAAGIALVVIARKRRVVTELPE